MHNTDEQGLPKAHRLKKKSSIQRMSRVNIMIMILFHKVYFSRFLIEKKGQKTEIRHKHNCTLFSFEMARVTAAPL